MLHEWNMLSFCLNLTRKETGCRTVALFSPGKNRLPHLSCTAFPDDHATDASQPALSLPLVERVLGKLQLRSAGMDKFKGGDQGSAGIKEQGR